MHKAPPAASSADPAAKEKEHKKNLDRDARAHGPTRLNSDRVSGCKSKARKFGAEEIPHAQLQRNPHGRNSPSYVRAKIHSPLDLECNTPETKEHLRHDKIYCGDTKLSVY